MTALDDIAAERRRQIEGEGWTPEHDDSHDSGQMARAAACYAVGHTIEQETRDPASTRRVLKTSLWPWSREWWKPKDRRRDLVRAAALIVAEIERLDRKDRDDG